MVYKNSAILQYNLMLNMSFVISNFRHYCKAYISLKIRGKYITKNTKCYLCNRLLKFLIIKSDWTAKSDGFCRKWTLRPVFFYFRIFRRGKSTQYSCCYLSKTFLLYLVSILCLPMTLNASTLYNLLIHI